MSISLITNFQINANLPIDSRIIATGPDALNNMEYKYEGLTVYRTDTQLLYVWDGQTWEIASDGIYGGSGSLVGDTNVELGFIGTNSTDQTYKLILSASSSTETLDYVSNFSRNSNTDIQFKNSLLFGTFSGPYILYNPDFATTIGRGGIAIGTGYINSYERLRIETNGIIRFKPNSSMTASINIYETDSDLTLGYNWYGLKDDGDIGASFLKFSKQILTINHSATNSVGYTHSVIIYNPDHEYTVEFNGSTRMKSMVLGYGDGFNTISNQGVGFGISKNGEEFSIFNRSNTKSISLIENRIDLGSSNYLVSITQSATFSTYGFFESRYQTSMWDNSFNVDRFGTSDNDWTRLPLVSDSFNDTSETNGINVFINSSTSSQDAQFVFKTISYTSKNTKSSWSTPKKPYDRIFYFYSEPNNYHITHELSWYLSNDDGSTWKKIGIVETGNQDNYNQDSGATASYATRYYSSSALVPANMDFKIKFRFNNSYTPTTTIATSSAPSVIFTVFRSGKWRTEISNEAISNI